MFDDDFVVYFRVTTDSLPSYTRVSCDLQENALLLVSIPITHSKIFVSCFLVMQNFVVVLPRNSSSMFFYYAGLEQ